MTQPPLDYNALMAIAEDRTSQSRGELFGQISTLLVDTHMATSDRERALMVDIIDRLFHDVEMQVRQELSARLSKQNNAPKELITMLANDTIEVAMPILVESDLLRDEELLEIIKHRTQEHQMAIAMRQKVSEVISDALVEAGHEDVVKTLLENPSAQISQATLEYLVEQSERVDLYQNPLLNRADLQPQLAKKMYTFVSETLKKKIVEEFKIDPATIESDLQDSVESIFSAEETDGYARTMELVEAISKSKELTPSLLAKTLGDGEIPLFVGLFSKMTEMPLKAAKKILFDSDGEVFALACKAMGFETHQFSDIYKLVRITRSGSRDVRITEMSHLLSYFEQLKRTTAQNILRSWQRDPGYLDSINKPPGKKGQAKLGKSSG